ncbi:hypothetical protein GCM10023095_27100 [Pseudaeromonas paramecii]|uniref:Uncharacterized protein n=1 Tax=Pseudaeromonas paramecii TaxID=2138166 RepID=A0ABP8QFD9_9GAMM
MSRLQDGLQLGGVDGIRAEAAVAAMRLHQAKGFVHLASRHHLICALSVDAGPRLGKAPAGSNSKQA